MRQTLIRIFHWSFYLFCKYFN